MVTTIGIPAYIIADPQHLDAQKRIQSILSQQADIIEQQHAAVQLCEQLIDPDGFGHSVTQEVRQEAYRALQLARFRPKEPPYEMQLAKPTKVYLAGPMTGLPEYSYPAFFQAADMLREQGLIVENPAEHTQRNPQPSWKGYMRQAIKILIECDEVYFLPRWRNSNGAGVEYHLAISLNMPRHLPEYWHPEYLDESKK